MIAAARSFEKQYLPVVRPCSSTMCRQYLPSGDTPGSVLNGLLNTRRAMWKLLRPEV